LRRMREAVTVPCRMEDARRSRSSQLALRGEIDFPSDKGLEGRIVRL